MKDGENEIEKSKEYKKVKTERNKWRTERMRQKRVKNMRKLRRREDK